MSNRYAPTNPDWLLSGKPLTLFRENIRRQDVTTDVAAALVTQVMTAVAMPFTKGELITSLSFVGGATAAGTPTNWWFALYDDAATPALIGQTADQLTAAWAANATKTLALATPYEVPRTAVYYAACMVKATTVPSLHCKVAPLAGIVGAAMSGQKVLSLSSGAALTTTAPATLAAPTTVVNIPYCVAT